MVARIVAIAVGFAVALGLWTVVLAGTLPNISGTWYANGNAAHLCSISQSGTSVSLRNQQGASASGTFTDPSTLDTNWGVFGGGHVIGHISSDLRTITWSNGTYWTRAGGSGSAPVPTASPTPFPHALHFSWGGAPGVNPPIEIIGAWAAQSYNRKSGWVCLSFKNTGSVAATLVRFHFRLLDKMGDVVEQWRQDRKGTFSSNTDIHGYHSLSEWLQGSGHRGYRDNCGGWHVENSREAEIYPTVRSATYSIERVDFADGTSWPRE